MKVEKLLLVFTEMDCAEFVAASLKKLQHWQENQTEEGKQRMCTDRRLSEETSEKKDNTSVWIMWQPKWSFLFTCLRAKQHTACYGGKEKHWQIFNRCCFWLFSIQMNWLFSCYSAQRIGFLHMSKYSACGSKDKWFSSVLWWGGNLGIHK